MSQLKTIMIDINKSLNKLNYIDRNLKRGDLESEIINDANFNEKEAINFIRKSLIEIKETTDSIAYKLKIS
ncbi:MAG: hypothetical protein K8R85_00680 [Bacteroidetes bacterium]|nr:hypothetical protein [Bacteroidota bacterium]